MYFILLFSEAQTNYPCSWIGKEFSPQVSFKVIFFFSLVYGSLTTIIHPYRFLVFVCFLACLFYVSYLVFSLLPVYVVWCLSLVLEIFQSFLLTSDISSTLCSLFLLLLLSKCCSFCNFLTVLWYSFPLNFYFLFQFGNFLLTYL